MIQVKYLAVFFGGANDLALFSQIDIGFRRGKAIPAACFNFNKTKRFAFKSDQVYFGIYSRAAHISADRDEKIRRHRAQPGLFQKADRKLLAPAAEHTSRVFGLCLSWEEGIHIDPSSLIFIYFEIDNN